MGEDAEACPYGCSSLKFGRKKECDDCALRSGWALAKCKCMEHFLARDLMQISVHFLITLSYFIELLIINYFI